MKKKLTCLSSLLLALLLILSLASCGASSSASDTAAGVTTYSDSKAEADYGYVVEEAAAEEAVEMEMADAPEPTAADTVGAETISNAAAETKLVYTARLEVEALDFDAAVKALDKLVEELGGYYESSSVYSYGNSRQADYTIRVPSEHYNAFIDACSDSDNCHLNYINEEVEDIGTAYFDAETRLNTLKTKMDRLQTLLSEATEMEDIITIESAISETEYEIELYTSTLNRYDSLVGYATVNLYMEEVIQLTEVEEQSVGSRLNQELRWGAENFVDDLIDLLYWAAYNLIGIIIFIAVVVLVVTLIRRKKRQGKLGRKDKKDKKKKNEREEALPEQNEKTEP